MPASIYDTKTSDHETSQEEFFWVIHGTLDGRTLCYMHSIRTTEDLAHELLREVTESAGPRWSDLHLKKGCSLAEAIRIHEAERAAEMQRPPPADPEWLHASRSSTGGDWFDETG